MGQRTGIVEVAEEDISQATVLLGRSCTGSLQNAMIQCKNVSVEDVAEEDISHVSAKTGGSCTGTGNKNAAKTKED